VIGAGEASSNAPLFFTLVDSLGVSQVYRFETVQRIGVRTIDGVSAITAPDTLRLVVARRGDTVTVTVAVDDATATRPAGSSTEKWFLQLHGRWSLDGRVAGQHVSDSGRGFFETWQR
jgi:hypothetical protein